MSRKRRKLGRAVDATGRSKGDGQYAKALVIDHTGNTLRFLNDTVDFWANGVDVLDAKAEKDRAARTAVEPNERKELVCRGCQAILPPGVSACLACGRERPRKFSGVTSVQGATQLLNMSARAGRKFDYAQHPLLCDPTAAYQSFLAFTSHRKRGDVDAGRPWAAGIYKGVFGHWPPRNYDDLPPGPLSLDVERFCRKEMARYSKSRAANAA